jgi:hypothetical protein
MFGRPRYFDPIWFGAGKLTVAAFLLSACSSAPIQPEILLTDVEQFPTRIQFNGVGEVGVFDASLVQNGEGRVWMGYSAVESPDDGSLLNPIHTRIAFSDDQRTSWQDAGLIINESSLIDLPENSPAIEAIWLHEVADLAYDPFGEPDKRWVITWFQYLRAIPAHGNQYVNLYEHSWIAMRSAPDPLGPWSDPVKLFTGALYDIANDASGAPIHRLNELYSGPEQLRDCATFTEPAVLVREQAIYVVLKCPIGGNRGKLVALKCAHDFSSCDYLGDFIDDELAAKYQTSYNGFSAPELVEIDQNIYLFATPTETEAMIYRGCFVFRVEDLDQATLESENGMPEMFMRIQGAEGSFSGACSYASGALSSGIIYNQAELDEDIEYQLIASGVNLQ